jgi:hypothetical protein
LIDTLCFRCQLSFGGKTTANPAHYLNVETLKYISEFQT